MNLFNKISRVELAGFLISFLGTLPFGVLNILAFIIALNETLWNAVLFSFGVVIVEIGYVYICFRLFNKLSNHFAFGKWIKFFIFLLVLILACNCLYSSFGKQPIAPGLHKNVPRFLLGLGLSAVNTLQIPFWLSWNAYLKERNILANEPGIIIRYLSGIGLGTFLGLMIFVCCACFLEKSGTVPTRKIDLYLAIILFGTALFMGYSLISERIKNISKV